MSKFSTNNVFPNGVVLSLKSIMWKKLYTEVTFIKKRNKNIFHKTDRKTAMQKIHFFPKTEVGFLFCISQYCLFTLTFSKSPISF